MEENKYSEIKEKTKTALIVLASFVLLLVLARLIDSISKNQIVNDSSFGNSPQQVLERLTSLIVDLPDLDSVEKEKINLERQKIINSLTP
jgi:hypothetical protein